MGITLEHMKRTGLNHYHHYHQNISVLAESVIMTSVCIGRLHPHSIANIDKSPSPSLKPLVLNPEKSNPRWGSPLMDMECHQNTIPTNPIDDFNQASPAVRIEDSWGLAYLADFNSGLRQVEGWTSVGSWPTHWTHHYTAYLAIHETTTRLRQAC